MKKLLVICSLFGLGSSSAHEVLVTPNYTVTIIGCKDGEVSCEDAKYIGVSRKTGNVMSLKGRTVHSTAPGGTLKQFLGYEFPNSNTVYSVDTSGNLLVKQGRKIVVDEKGKWVD